MAQSRSDFQDLINFIVEAGSRAEEVIDIPREYPDAMRAGAEYSELMARPGWKRLLDDMEKRADKALENLRTCESADPTVIVHMRNIWREAESSLLFIQITAAEAVEGRRAVVQDLGIKFGDVEGLDVNDLMDEQNIKDFMQGKFKSKQ